MAEMTTLHDALVEELKDLYDAEKQLVKALPRMAKSAASPELRMAIEAHLEETANQIARLEQAFELLDETARGKRCAGIAGIIEEGSDVLASGAEGAVMDAMIIASAQRAEHYEIGAYGTACAWAKALDLTELADLLHETLEEEKAADEKLTMLAEQGINDAASVGADDADEDEEHEEEELESGSSTGGSASSASSRKMSPERHRKS
jgi:ferritin-like metal-binding protein YciE